MNKYIALAGNQNSGKSTLFNVLTGSNQHVGNFPGVTIEKKEGTIKDAKELTLVDLPGIYSLSPYTSEEIVTRDFLLKEKPEAIINIIDATNIERNLYLTLQLMELGIPMIIALNFMDEVIGSGNSIDVEKLSESLNIPIVPISAIKGEGITELVHKTKEVAEGKVEKLKMDFCKGELHKALHAIMHMIYDNAKAAGYPVRFAATKLIEGDSIVLKNLKIDNEETHIIEHIVEDMEYHLQTDREAALADMRYSYIEELCALCVKKRNETREQKRSEKIDAVLTHKYWGIPIFLFIMVVIFYLTFDLFGAPLQELFRTFVSWATNALSNALVNAEASEWVRSLVVDGICAGIGSVISFLPIIIILFFFLSMLEDSGYMARVAFVMDKLLRKIGLSGMSFVPMIIGFGCSVPAIMATRTLPSERDRNMTIILTPFMSCSAKLPLYAMITTAFFVKNSALVMAGLYVNGMIVAVLCGLLLKNTVFKGNPVPFVMELPAYRIPAARNVLMHMWEKGKDFIQKAFTVIFVASIVIWFLQNFSSSIVMVSDSSQSILAKIGAFVAPVFKPLGFSDWKLSTALMTGFAAKETVVSTLMILTQSSTQAQLSIALNSLLNIPSSLSFLAFSALYMPCAAAFAASKRELKKTKYAIYASLFQTVVAYIAAFVIYHIALLFF